MKSRLSACVIVITLLVLTGCATLASVETVKPEFPPRGTLKVRLLWELGNHQLDYLAIIAFTKEGGYRAQLYSDMGILLADFGYDGRELSLYSIPRGFPRRFIVKGLHRDLTGLLLSGPMEEYTAWFFTEEEVSPRLSYTRKSPVYSVEMIILSLDPTVKIKELLQND